MDRSADPLGSNELNKKTTENETLFGDRSKSTRMTGGAVNDITECLAERSATIFHKRISAVLVHDRPTWG